MEYKQNMLGTPQLCALAVSPDKNVIIEIKGKATRTKNNKVIKIVPKIVTKYLLDIEMCQPHGWLYTAVVLPDSSADENL